MMEYIDVEFDDWEEAAMREAQTRDDYLEMLMQYMARHEQDDMRGRDAISWWQVFAREYPAVAAEMEKWLEARHD